MASLFFNKLKTLRLALLLVVTLILINPTFIIAQTSKALQSTDKSISFFPNPFQNSMTLEVKGLPANNTTVKVEVYNIIGKIFYKNEFKFQNTEAKFNIDLESLQPGVYFMYIINSEKKVFKIIKEGNPTSSGTIDNPLKNWIRAGENT